MKYTIKEVQAFASASAIAQEVLQNILTVTAFHGQEKEEERSVSFDDRDEAKCIADGLDLRRI